MVLVFILFAILILFLLFVTIMVLSTLQIEIKNLKLGNKEKEKETRIKEKYEVKISLYFLGKIPFFWFRLNNQRMRKIYQSKRLQKIDLKKIEKKVPFQKETLEMIKGIKLRIVKLNLNIAIGTEDAIITSYLIAGMASAIGIALPHLAKEHITQCHYIVTPIYQDRNQYYISLDSIIRVKIVHIIYSMLNFAKKGREKHERTSNRRSYAYRYE